MKKKTILIIDDESVVVKLFRFYLEKKYNVLEAHDGEEGLQMISREHPDMVILDVNMPKMGGIEFYNKISLDTGKPPFPVILLTVREELGPFFRDLDVDGFITKPCVMDAALKEIDAIMHTRYGMPVDAEPPNQKSPGKVLIVDDNAANLGTIAAVFLDAGYIVDSAKSGMQAIEKMLTGILPEAVIIKLDLADVPGDLVCLKLKQMPRTMDIPFVLYSAPGEPLEKITLNRMCGILKAHFVENGEPSLLLKKIEEAFGRRLRS